MQGGVSMKERYTIGEVAALLNMSPQTIRFYDKSGIVVPHYTDQKTGYRYYSYDQIHYISRVKYLQRFGFRLEDIREALASNDIGQFKQFLIRRRQSIQKELDHLQELLKELDWYVEYYDHIDYYNYNNLPYKVKEPERYLLAEPLAPGEDIYGTAGKRLTKLQHSEAFSHTRFLRQNGYLLDFPSLLAGKIVPTHYFVYLRELPEIRCPNLMRIPAGTYFCTQSRILSEPFDSTLVRQYFRDAAAPCLALANEYEDNFTSFKDCIYEVQVLEMA